MKTEPSIFESFNARALEPEQVAKTFVPSDNFRKLSKRGHSVIVGPRGSGKTTLLKMLQNRALESWIHEEAIYYRTHIDFTGVFVATDVSWNEQLKAVSEGVLDQRSGTVFSFSSFTTHILHAIIEAILYRVHPPENDALFEHNRIVLSPEMEASLIRELVGPWKIGPISPNLLSLKHALRARLLLIKEVANRTTLERTTEGQHAIIDSHPFLYLDFMEAASYGLEVFSDTVHDSVKKWALMFDELELAPKRIREELMRALRSVDQKLLFKLSISPFSEDTDLSKTPTTAMTGQDYEEIPLWYPRKEEGYAFCSSLVSGMLKERNLINISPARLFGQSEFETNPQEWKTENTSYRAESKQIRRFEKMAAKDPSFNDYLNERNIDLKHLENLSPTDRAAILRKVTSIVTIREAFLTFGKNQDELIGFRSRKKLAIYGGAKSLFAVAEGNPRWVIGIVGNLLGGTSPSTTEINAIKQAGAIVKTMHRFRALLKTIPCGKPRHDEQAENVLTLLDRIGNYFFSSVTTQKFNPDPVLTFTVDRGVDEELLESLGRALNTGAIVYVPEDNSECVLTSLIGKRFRLSYLLAPNYKLPLILGRDLSLSAILGDFGIGRSQLRLFK